MRINVVYLAQLQKVAGKNSESFSCNGPINIPTFIKDVVCAQNEIFKQYILDKDGNILPVLMVFVSDEQIINLDLKRLNDGDELVLMLPIAGG